MLSLVLLLLASDPAPVHVKPRLTTQQVAVDPDDPAIWVHPTDPRRSLILGTDKGGALYVFDLDGKVKQVVEGIDRPNNVDVEVGFKTPNGPLDIAVLTERGKERLRVFAIDPKSGDLKDITGETRVFADAKGDEAAPMGIGLYRRPKDGEVFAIVSRKAGPSGSYLGQYRLTVNASGLVDATEVRRFGNFSGQGEIEAIAVDDALNMVYFADEGGGIRKVCADPDAPDANQELAFFGQTGFEADREGIAIIARPDGTGYIVCVDQRKGDSHYRFYKREGESGRPHDHEKVVAVLHAGADSTDGLEIVNRPLGQKFPVGVLVAMTSGPKAFVVLCLDDVTKMLGLRRSGR